MLDLSGQRVSAGSAPLRVRLVKGANLAMESALAETAAWPRPAYPEKVLTDASYKALVERLLHASSRGTVKAGIAVHNLFDVAFALVLSGELSAHVDIEMLAGMAPSQAAAVAEHCGGVLVYTPVVARRDFRNALAYLARRLDENITPEGFLRHALELEPGNQAWLEQFDIFSRSVKERHTVRCVPFHEQDRTVIPNDLPAPGPRASDVQAHGRVAFRNEPPTDLASAANCHWAAACLQRASDHGVQATRDARPTRSRCPAGDCGRGRTCVGTGGPCSTLTLGRRRRRRDGPGACRSHNSHGGGMREDIRGSRQRSERGHRLRAVIRCRSWLAPTFVERARPSRPEPSSWNGGGGPAMELPLRDPGGRGRRSLGRG